MHFRWSHLRLQIVCAFLVGAALAVTLTALDVRHSMSSAGLPYPQADRLVTLVAGSKSWSPGMLELARTLPTFELLAGVQERNARLQFADQAEIVRLESVSATYFELLGLTPSAGRVFTADEDRRSGQAPIAVISDRLWRRRFAGARDALGRTLDVDDRPLQVIGVMATGGLIGRTDVWVPLGSARWLTGDTGPERPTSRWFEVFGRLSSSVTLEQASLRFAAEMPAAFAAAGLPASGILGSPPRLSVRLLSDTRVPPIGRQAATILVWAAAGLSLFVLMSVSSLLLLRGQRRAHSMTIQLALGAASRHLLGPPIREGAVIGTVGAGVALLIRPLLTAALAAVRPPATNFGIVTANWIEPAALLSRPTLSALALTIAMCCGISLSIAGAMLRRARTKPMRESSPPGGLSRAVTPAVWLLALQTALACAVLAGAMLMTTAVMRVLGVERGYNREQVFTARLDLPNDYDLPRAAAFHHRLAARLTSTPGVSALSMSTCAPGAGRCRQSNISRVDGVAVHPEQIGVHIVSPRHFETIGAEISRGRELRDDDRIGGVLAVVITDSLAARLWPGGDPIGRQLEVSSANRSLDGMRTVVGTVKPIRFNVDDDPGLDVYLPMGQVLTSSVVVFIKGSIDHGQALAILSREVAQLDSRAPVHDPASLESRLSTSLAAERLLAAALVGLAAMAVLLAVVCTYTLTAQTVASAQHELAIRRALGATAARVGRLVVVRASVIAAIGALVGTGLAFAGARLLSSLLHGTPQDHPIVLLAPVVMIAALGTALIGPVRQAVRVNILLAMRER